MNPAEVLKPVYITKADLPFHTESPARDLAILRERRFRGPSPERWEKIINLKWRIRYIELFKKENR